MGESRRWDFGFDGVGLCFPLITLITAFSLLYGNGGAPLCAIERGKGDEKEAQMLMGNTFAMLVLTGIVLMVFRTVLFTGLCCTRLGPAM